MVEQKWLDAPAISLDVRQRLLAHRRYPFRVTFETSGKNKGVVNKKLVLQRMYARPPNWLAKQVGAEKGITTRADAGGELLGWDSVLGREIPFSLSARPGKDTDVLDAMGTEYELMSQEEFLELVRPSEDGEGGIESEKEGDEGEEEGDERESESGASGAGGSSKQGPPTPLHALPRSHDSPSQHRARVPARSFPTATTRRHASTTTARSS